jgi:hypothetical protein
MLRKNFQPINFLLINYQFKLNRKVFMEKKLTAQNLKNILWDTLKKLKGGTIEVSVADAIASQSREIVRVIKSQQAILQQAHQNVTDDLLEYVK